MFASIGLTSKLGMSLPFILQRQLADLRLHVLHARAHRFALFRRSQKHATGPFQQMGLPLHDLAGVHIKLLRQLRQRLVALERC